MVVAVPREDATVMLAIDVSASMRATDVTPTRLDAARETARSFIAQLPKGIRVGIVAFASRPVTLVAPTADRAQLDAALTGLQALDGTAMGDALMQVLDIAEKVQAGDAATAGGATPSPTPAPSATPGTAVDTPSGQPLVAAILLSDGANSVGAADPIAAAERAASLGVPIYTIALGTSGGVVQVLDETGRTVTVPVPPDRTTLAQIGQITGAAAFDAPTAEDLSSVYASLQSRIGYTNQEQEMTAWFAAGALALIVVAAGLSAVWFGRLP
jgi:Ca-activated chloride channel family protein